MTFDTTAKTKLIEYLETHQLASGLGTEKSAGSIAAINLAISGKLTDKIPDCMSLVIGRWILNIQDAIPPEMRNSKRYKAALIEAASSGRNHEKERLELIMDWLWVEVLPRLQDLANKGGYGKKWRVMCQDKTADAAYAAYAVDAAYAARSARSVADAVACVVAADAYAAVRAAAEAAADAADAAARTVDAARAARSVAYADVNNSIWDEINPIGLLEKLVTRL